MKESYIIFLRDNHYLKAAIRRYRAYIEQETKAEILKAAGRETFRDELMTIKLERIAMAFYDDYQRAGGTMAYDEASEALRALAEQPRKLISN